MNAKLQLKILNFFQLFIWGAWLITMANYWFGTKHWDAQQFGEVFTTMGIASVFMPTLVGIIVDRWINAERVYSVLLVLYGMALLYLPHVDTPSGFFWVMLIAMLFYMPTLALNNSVSYAILKQNNLDVVKAFPPIRVMGTIGFIVAMWVTNLTGKVIEAHADEISWYVKYISEDGLLYVVRNGGSDAAIAPSKRVNIHTKNGVVRGVFGWPAIHTRNRSGDDVHPKIDNIFIDCGCANKKDVEALGIHVGCVITYTDSFEILNNTKFVCRAIDNRMGGFMIAEVARLLKENANTLPFGLYIVNAVQEEVGLRGAQMITNRIQPNVAIITDVCHDTTTPMISKQIEGDQRIGRGPVIAHAPAVQNKLRELIIETAEENNIPFQRNALSRETGTDTDAFAYSNGGVASALISLPLRYMHTTVEMVDRSDVENTIQLIYNTLLKIKENHDFSYFA